jgi:hypothetical protein
MRCVIEDWCRFHLAIARRDGALVSLRSSRTPLCFRENGRRGLPVAPRLGSRGSVTPERLDPATVDAAGQSVLSKGLRKPGSGGPRSPRRSFLRTLVACRLLQTPPRLNGGSCQRPLKFSSFRASNASALIVLTKRTKSATGRQRNATAKRAQNGAYRTRAQV